MKKTFRGILCAACCLLLAFVVLVGCADDGERLSFSAEKVFTESHEVSRSYQGAAAYGKYFFQFSDHMENVGVYDLDEKKLIGVTSLQKNELYHCNNAGFGKEFWSEEDEFPLLYVSMENIDAHCALVFRVQKADGAFVFTIVQTIRYPDPRTGGAYYPNSVVDGENGLIYVMGYTENSYEKKKNNRIRVTKFGLPGKDTSDVQLKAEDALDDFEVESVTATQGAIVRKGIIYQVYGFGGKSFLKLLDSDKKEYIATVRLPKYKFRAEPECLVYYNGALFCADVNGVVYRFSVVGLE